MSSGKLDMDKDGRVSVEFRRKLCNSPNTDAHAVSSEEGPTITTTVSSLSTMSVTDKEAHSSLLSATGIAVRSTIDPFTLDVSAS